MAQPECTFCGEEYGVLMDSDLVDGGTQVIGPACLPGYAIMLAAAVTTGMTPELAEVYGQYFDQIAANDTRVKRKSRKPSKQEQNDGISGNNSAGALTQSDIDQLIAADQQLNMESSNHVLTDIRIDEQTGSYWANCSCGTSFEGDRDSVPAQHQRHLQSPAS